MKKLLPLLVCFSSFAIQAQDIWTEVTAPFSNSNIEIKEISIVDNSTVWFSGTTNEIYPINNSSKWSRSIDGGNTWVEGDFNFGNSNLVAYRLFAVSQNTAYTFARWADTLIPDAVWVTNDAGINWTRQSTSFENSILPTALFIHFFDLNNGIISGTVDENGDFYIYTTTDSGTNWVRLPLANIPPLINNNEIPTFKYFALGDSIYFITNYNRIFKSSDKGLHWTVFQSPSPSYYNGYSSFDMSDQNNGVFTDGTFNLWATTDSGLNWNSVTPQGNFRSVDIVYIPQTLNTYFAIGMGSQNLTAGSSLSTDGGLNWTDLNNNSSNPVISLKVKIKNPTTGYCTGFYQSEESLHPQRTFKLNNNFNQFLKNDYFTINKNKITISPNPSTELVKVSGAIFNEIIISDISGKTVYSENYSDLNETSINISKLENGVYFAAVYNKNGDSTVIKIIKN